MVLNKAKTPSKGKAPPSAHYASMALMDPAEGLETAMAAVTDMQPDAQADARQPAGSAPSYILH